MSILVAFLSLFCHRFHAVLLLIYPYCRLFVTSLSPVFATVLPSMRSYFSPFCSLSVIGFHRSFAGYMSIPCLLYTSDAADE